MNTFTRQEIEVIHSKSVCITGCGGLGGYTAMSLARFGVKKITLIDGDRFNTSNLNRQLFCNETNIGRNKAQESAKALREVNSSVEIEAAEQFLDAENCKVLLPGHDAAIDCLDNIPSRLILEKGCKDAGIALIHGAVNGAAGQVTCVLPGDDTLSRLYAGSTSSCNADLAGNPAFSPQLVSAVQCSQALKLLAGRDDLLTNRLLLIDIIHYEMNIIDI